MCRAGIAAILWPLFFFAVAGCSNKPTDEAGDFYGDAFKAYKAGDQEGALTLVNKAIEKRPTPWAYVLRGRIHLDKKAFDEAREDAAKGLALDPNNRDLVWLDAELKKPEGQRFKGPNRQPPSEVK